MASVESQLIEQLKGVGNRLLKPPSSSSELLNLLDEMELLLSKFGQSPSQPVKEALLVPMKALMVENLTAHSDDDIKVTVASCMNEIMRISAPVAPYEEKKMKEFFELIIFSFNKLSNMSTRSYSKAVSILENVARLQSCVMMLDLDCDSLIAKMFEVFLKNISSDHPPSVFRAMEKIMNLVVEECDAMSPDVLKVLLTSIRKENEQAAPTSWKLGSKVIEQGARKVKPYILTTIKSLNSCLDDYAPILSTFCPSEPESVNNGAQDTPKHMVNNENLADKSHNERLAAKVQVVEIVQSLKAVDPSSRNAARKSDSKADRVTDSGAMGSKKAKKTNSQDPVEGLANRSVKGKSSLGSPHGRSKKSPFGSKGEERPIPAMEDEVLKVKTEETTDLEEKQPHQDTSFDDSDQKKGRLSKPSISGGSGRTDSVSPKSTMRPSKKEKFQMNDGSKSRKKRASIEEDDEVFETPHGRKNYKEDLIDSRIKVWWPLDAKYYEGTITSYDASTRKHRVDYDDGDEEILNLRKERWEFLGDEDPEEFGLFALRQTHQLPVNERKREGSAEVGKEAFKNNNGKKRTVHDSGAKSNEGSQQGRKEVENSKMSEMVSETKKPKLSDE